MLGVVLTGLASAFGQARVSAVRFNTEGANRMHAVIAVVNRLVRRPDGQDLIEYGLLVALIAVVAIIAVTAVGNTVNSLFWQTFANAM